MVDETSGANFDWDTASRADLTDRSWNVRDDFWCNCLSAPCDQFPPCKATKREGERRAPLDYSGRGTQPDDRRGYGERRTA